MNEQDWRHFSPLRDRLLERFCTRIIDEVVAMATRTDIAAHDRYLKIFQLVQDRDKQVAYMFYQPARSRMRQQVFSMIDNDLFTEEELAGFSEEGRREIATIRSMIAEQRAERDAKSHK